MRKSRVSGFILAKEFSRSRRNWQILTKLRQKIAIFGVPATVREKIAICGFANPSKESHILTKLRENLSISTRRKNRHILTKPAIRQKMAIVRFLV